MTFTHLAREVRAYIGQDHRYEHSVRVARCAEVLARRHGGDAGKARLAGMLHDLARLFPAKRLLSECSKRRMPIDAFERDHPVVLHARLSAAIARERFGVDDEQVLSAIEKHTLAAPHMTRLDCVLYLADGLEPGRSFFERTALWSLALRDLDAGMREMLQATLRHMSQKGRAAAPQTIAAAASFGLHVPQERKASVSAS